MQEKTNIIGGKKRDYLDCNNVNQKTKKEKQLDATGRMEKTEK